MVRASNICISQMSLKRDDSIGCWVKCTPLPFCLWSTSFRSKLGIFFCSIFHVNNTHIWAIWAHHKFKLKVAFSYLKLKTLLENLKIVVQFERNFCSPLSLSATQCEDPFDLEKWKPKFWSKAKIARATKEQKVTPHCNGRCLGG